VTVDARADVSFRLAASLEGLCRRMDDREAQVRNLAESVSAVETRGIAFLGSSAPGGLNGALAPHQWGPSLGWTWAVQLITVGPLGTGDTLAVYRGKTSSDNETQRLKYQFAGSNGEWQAWSPGRTGLILHGGREGLVFDPGSGTLTSATRYFVNVDVIQVEDQYFSYFLL
jgi:hypothetical protein